MLKDSEGTETPSDVRPGLPRQEDKDRDWTIKDKGGRRGIWVKMPKQRL